MKEIATILVVGGIVVIGYVVYSNYQANAATNNSSLTNLGSSLGTLATNLSEDYSSLSS